jgi:hypothetical protein
VLGGMIALASLNIGLAILAAFGFIYCMNLRRALFAAGPEEYSDTTDYSAAYEVQAPRRKSPGRWAVRRAAKLAQQETNEQQKIDAILAKVSAHGIQSLSWLEKRTLKQATERQRRRDLERARLRRG